METIRRFAAAAIAIVAGAGLVVQCIILYRQNCSILLTLWIVLGFFTITTNVLVAVVFSGIAANRSSFGSDWLVAGTMLSILLVGLVYACLLHGLTELSGGSAVANVLLHMVTPVLVPLFWMSLTRKGGLTWQHPFLWATYPSAYLIYGLARGTATGKYAYPFIDIKTLGWKQTSLNVSAIASVFLLCAFAIVWIDHRILSSRVAQTRQR